MCLSVGGGGEEEEDEGSRIGQREDLVCDDAQRPQPIT